MSREQKKGLMFFIFLGLTIVTIFFGGCGQNKKKIVEIEQPPNVKPPVEQFCDGLPISTVRDKECPDNAVGNIVEVCRPDGLWYEASRDCRQSCESGGPTWENTVQKVMIDNCVDCHGTYRDYTAVKNLANTGLGGSGGISKLVYYVSLPQTNDKSMPKDLPNLDNGVINSLKDWVDAGAPEKSNCEEFKDDVDLLYIDRAINNFGNQIPIPEDRSKYRFFTFATEYNQGKDLAPGYKALNRTLNSLSFENDIELCQPVDIKGVVCAFSIDSIGFTAHDFKVIDEFDEINFVSNTSIGILNKQIFNTEKPFYHYENFITTTLANARLYYLLMGYEFQNQVYQKFGINLAQTINDLEYKLIGTSQSAISSGRNTRLIVIMEGEINGFDTQLHFSLDNPALDGKQFDLFQSPFISDSKNIFAFTASESIIGLPNGMLTFILNNNQGILQSEAPEDIVFCNTQECLDPTIKAAISCFLCHHDGYIPKQDDIGAFIRESRQFNADDVKLAKQVYLDENINFATFNKHNKKYIASLKQMNIEVGETNHLIEAYNAFERSKNLEEVAAFLFVDPSFLKACIGSSINLSKTIGTLLTNGKVSKDNLINILPDLFEECEINIDPILPGG